MPPNKEREGWERVLLLGGPFHFQAANVRAHQYELLIIMPTPTTELMTREINEEASYNAPIDLLVGKTARYVRSTEFVKAGRSYGWVFEYQGMN